MEEDPPMRGRDADALEALWKRATVGTPARSVDANRERDGNYVRGFRKDNDTWEHQIAGYVITATRTDWQTFNLAADRDGTQRWLVVKQDGRVIFEAFQEGASTQTNFSAPDERYGGKQQADAQPWQILQGEIPAEVAPEGHP